MWSLHALQVSLGCSISYKTWIIYLAYWYNLTLPTLPFLPSVNEPMLFDDDLGYRIGKWSRSLNSSPSNSTWGDAVGLNIWVKGVHLKFNIAFMIMLFFCFLNDTRITSPLFPSGKSSKALHWWSSNASRDSLSRSQISNYASFCVQHWVACMF